MKDSIENKIVGILNSDNKLKFVKNDENVKKLWANCLVEDEGGMIGAIDDLVVFVGDSKDEVKENVMAFMKNLLEHEYFGV
jgi:hypothetical protein